MKNANIRAVARYCSKPLDSIGVVIDKEEGFKRRIDAKRTRRATLYNPFRTLCLMMSGTRKPVDVERMQVVREEDLIVGPRILFQDVQLNLGPIADLINLYAHFERNFRLIFALGQVLRSLSTQVGIPVDNILWRSEN